MKLKAIILTAVAVLLFLPQLAETCGPFFSSAVFVRTLGPDRPLEAFAHGKLGVVLPTWKIAYRVVAYRYLIGKPLSAEEQQSLLNYYNENKRIDPPSQSEDGVATWAAARSRFLPDPGQPPGTYKPAQDGFSEYSNCLAPAFVQAAATLGDRARQFGEASPELKEWIAGQDMVFRNCDGVTPSIPPDLPGTSNSLLRADRAYQIAAARFYVGTTDDYEIAQREFRAIAADTSSPWHETAAYLVARTYIREAALAAPKDQAFDPATLKKAEAELRAILADSRDASIHHAALNLLGFVDDRLRPAERHLELGKSLAAGAGKHFGQDLLDYAWLGPNDRLDDDLSKWIAMGGSPEKALATWRRTHQEVWLVAALWQIDPDNAAFRELMDAAACVPESSPAFATVSYSRVRFAREAGNSRLAHQILDSIPAHQRSLPSSSQHLFQDEQVQLAATFDAFVSTLTQIPVDFDDYAGDIDYCDLGKPGKCGPEFSPAAATLLNTRVPIRIFARVAASRGLPANLRRRLAPAAWARAALLDDTEVASQIGPVAVAAQPALGKFVQQFGSAKTAAERRFVAAYIILHFPGLCPYAESSDFRRASFQGIDEFRNNGWSWTVGGDVLYPFGISGPGSGRIQIQVQPASATSRARIAWVIDGQDIPHVGFPEFLTEREKDSGTDDWDRLYALGPASDFLPKVVLDWGKKHPDDQRVPEALYLSIRAMRYGSSNKLSHAAFLMLHEKYPQSEWARKTPYWFKE